MKTKLAIAFIIMAVTSRVAFADVMDDCRQQSLPDNSRRACTEIINGQNFGPHEKALAYGFRGQGRTRAGAFREAIADFTQSIRLNKELAPAFMGRGEANFLAGNFPSSIADYSEAIRLQPNASDLFIERGRVYTAAGQMDNAIRDLTEAIRLAPKNANALNTRGLAYIRMNDLDKAKSDYDAAIAINPLNPVFYANRGYLYEAQGKKTEAIADLQRAIRYDPSLTDAGKALKRLGAGGSLVSESDQRILLGKELTNKNCGRCHAIGLNDVSPDKNAAEFRTLSQRYPNIALRAPIAQGIAASHDQMSFVLSFEQVDMIVAYINSLQPTR